MTDKKNNNSLFAVIFAVVVIAAAAIFVVTLMKGTKEEAEIMITDGVLEITGQYGVSSSLEDIEEVRLQEEIPEIGRKVNGAGLGSIRKGDYEVEGMGTCRLFLHAESGPYLYIKTEGKYLIVNYADAQKTEDAYERLQDQLSSL